MRLISNPRLWGAVRQSLALTVALLTLSCSLIGCLEGPSQETGPDLVVTYQATNATILETFEEGQWKLSSGSTLPLNTQYEYAVYARIIGMSTAAPTRANAKLLSGAAASAMVRLGGTI